MVLEYSIRVSGIMDIVKNKRLDSICVVGKIKYSIRYMSNYQLKAAFKRVNCGLHVISQS